MFNVYILTTEGSCCQRQKTIIIVEDVVNRSIRVFMELLLHWVECITVFKNIARDFDWLINDLEVWESTLAI